MRLKHRFLCVILGALGTVCLSVCSAIAAEAQALKASVTIAQGSTPPPLPPETPSTDLSAVRALHQQMNDRYNQQMKAVTEAANQRQQAVRQQYNETIQRHEAQAAEDAKQAEVPTRTPFQPAPPSVAQAASPSVAQAASPPPLPAESPSIAEAASPPPLPAESPSIAEAPASSSAQSFAAAPVQAPAPSQFNAAPKSSTKANAKKLSLGELSFACGSKNGTPATIAKLNNREIGVILWVSTLFADRGFDPQTRCNLVSQRFREYNKANQLNYLTTGTINRLPVVCVTSQADGACGDGIASNAGLLFTLKPDSDGGEILEQLSNVLTANANTPTDPLKQ